MSGIRWFFFLFIFLKGIFLMFLVFPKKTSKSSRKALISELSQPEGNRTSGSREQKEPWESSPREP
jgi:hypothetical protein